MLKNIPKLDVRYLFSIIDPMGVQVNYQLVHIFLKIISNVLIFVNIYFTCHLFFTISCQTQQNKNVNFSKITQRLI